MNDRSKPRAAAATAPAPAAHAHLHADSAANADFRREHPLMWWLTLAGPPVLTLLVLLVLAEIRGAEFVGKLIGTALATFFLFGRFVILGGSDGEMGEIQAFLSSGELFAMVVWMDLVTACVLAFHLGFIYRLPRIGPMLEALGRDGQFILHANRWMRRATFAGLVAFVAFPLAATGSVGGAIFGRLLGMSRAATFVGVLLGSLVGCGAMYFGAEVINRYIDKDNPWLVVGGVVVIAALVLFLNHRYRQYRDRFYGA